jgi:hypothetical protein
MLATWADTMTTPYSESISAAVDQWLAWSADGRTPPLPALADCAGSGVACRLAVSAKTSDHDGVRVGESMVQANMGEKRRWKILAGRSGLALAVAGVALLAGVACSDRGNATISSAGTLAAKPGATSTLGPDVTPVPVDERVYRNQIASLSRTLSVELASLSAALSNPQDTEDWLNGLSGNISQANIQLDLLRGLTPPAERYVEFDKALDASLNEHIAALDELTTALQAADTALIREAGIHLSEAGELFQAAVALMPPE